VLLGTGDAMPWQHVYWHIGLTRTPTRMPILCTICQPASTCSCPVFRQRPLAAITLHFVVAINIYPEPVEDSAWFAVDVPHQRVLAGLAG